MKQDGVDYPDSRPFQRCLNKGFVALVDTFGSDASIVQAARVSYGKGNKDIATDAKLLSYLLRHRHTSPFEMVEMKFHCRMPIFVARQWIRHRTANVNEYSGRYSVMKPLFYIPHLGSIATQSKANKQGRDTASLKELAHDLGVDMRDLLECSDSELPTQRYWDQRLFCIARDPNWLSRLYGVQQKIEFAGVRAYAEYEDLLEQGIAKELARTILPLSLYSEWYWKMDLHNLLHFLRLRLDEHAQPEIRVYAEAIAQFVQEKFPFTWDVFEDMNAGCFLTGEERKAIDKGLGLMPYTMPGHVDDIIKPILERLKAIGFSDRRIKEFRAKMGWKES